MRGKMIFSKGNIIDIIRRIHRVLEFDSFINLIDTNNFPYKRLNPH